MSLPINKRRIFFTAFLISYSFSIPATIAGGILQNTATYSFKKPNGTVVSGQTNQLKQTLVDPFGRIRGCGGEILPDYSGFSVGLYEAGSDDSLRNIVPLTRTGPGTNFQGQQPNIQNLNPYLLNNDEPKGTYNFLLNRNNGQMEIGKRYILVINPPSGRKEYTQRQIRIVITGRDDVANTVSYTATALDGKGIGLDGDPSSFSTTVAINDGTTTGLALSAVSLLDRPICVGPDQLIQITKSGDRATAEPGDTVIYRLSVKNVGNANLNNIVVTDNLPLGFDFLPKSVRGELDKQSINITPERNGSTVKLRTQVDLAPGKVLNIAYATQLTNDAVRGNGRNTAIVNGKRTDTGFVTKDGPASHQLKIRPGITSDCGTIIGRVFVDKNFDGEQQTNEPGVPNAVIFMQDGNRITTDPNGLFSVANALPGSHVGTLDISSLPGYTLAPNVKFRERNSQSRLVRLEPGGLVRMNFAVTPTFQEEVKK